MRRPRAELLVLALVLGGCGAVEPEAGTGGAEPAAAPLTATGSANTIATRVGDAGTTVTLPAGWHTTTANDGAIVDPVTRLVVASSPIRLSQNGCQVAYAFADDAVALVVVEWNELLTLAPPRPERFTSRELSVVPPPAIECFDGAGGSVQFVDQGRVFGAYLLVGPAAPESLVVEARRVLDTLEVEPAAASRRLERNGVSLTAPIGWDSRILFRDRTGSWGVVFQAANFELPPNRGLEPPQQLPLGQEDPIKAMAGGDVLVTVVSDEADGTSTAATITLDDLRFLPADAPRVPHGHALAEGSFCFESRCVQIEVVFGRRVPASTERGQVNDLLASILVEPSARSADTSSAGEDPRGCPRPDWPGPWTACAEADWVRGVVEAGGYRVVGETGSALVAEGKGRSFYIWTTRARRSPAAMAVGNWRHLADVNGVGVYGDEVLWRFWEAQGSIFWVKEGPTGDSVVPSPHELEALLEASRAVRPSR